MVMEKKDSQIWRFNSIGIQFLGASTGARYAAGDSSNGLGMGVLGSSTGAFLGARYAAGDSSNGLGMGVLGSSTGAFLGARYAAGDSSNGIGMGSPRII